jgi:hypothetical protein
LSRKRDFDRRFPSTTLFGVLLSPRIMIPGSPKRKN